MNCRSEVLDKVDSLPAISSAVPRMLQLLGDPDVGIQKLVEVVKYDTILTAKVLRLANSTYCASSRPVATIKEALVRLGISRLYRLVIASSVQPMLIQPLAGYELDCGELWRHCVAVGVTAEIIQSRLGGQQADLSFTAGLLHDIGKLVIASHVAEYFESIDRKSIEENISFEKAEIAVLGICHNDVGARVLEEWSFPSSLVAVARWHHSPDQATESQRLVDLVHIADTICMMVGIGLGREGLRYEPSSTAMARLGLNEAALESVACKTLGAMDGLMEMFKNDGGD